MQKEIKGYNLKPLELVPSGVLNFTAMDKNDIIPIINYTIRDKLKWCIDNIGSEGDRNTLELIYSKIPVADAEEPEVATCKYCGKTKPLSEMRFVKRHVLTISCWDCYKEHTASTGILRTLRSYTETLNRYQPIGGLKDQCRKYNCPNLESQLYPNYDFTTYKCALDGGNNFYCDVNWEKVIDKCEIANYWNLYVQLMELHRYRLSEIVNEISQSELFEEIVEYRVIINDFKNKMLNLKNKEHETSKH